MKSILDFTVNEEPKIILESVCVLHKESLPVKINSSNIESIIFNFFEITSFFVIGSKNVEF